MSSLLALLYVILCCLIIIFVPVLAAPHVAQYGAISVFDTSRAVLLATALASVAGYFSHKQGTEGTFLLRLFIAALMVRMIVGTAIFVFRGQDFFGGDALTYDFVGFAQVQGWAGDKYLGAAADQFIKAAGSGWGMVYLVAGIYKLVGRNMLAVQLVNSVVGAVTAVLIFLCAHQVFKNVRVAKVAGIAVAFYPSLVLWSSQGLKDGPIVFCLALAILATLKLGQKLSVRYVVALVFALLTLLSLRFYVFYMICAAIAGAFVIGMQTITATSFARQLAAVLLVGLALTYFGVTRSANLQFQEYGNLERVQRSRLDLARSADSGFGRDVDVSTTSGALSTIPMGMIYLLFAPFPWQVGSLRQSITLPEMIIWWASFPLLILGLWYAIKYRLRMIAPILVFTFMLTLSYSVFQGNVGTAYRQRAQLLVFYFIFVAVGFVLVQEKREERKRRRLEALVAQRAAATVVRTAARSH
ncbi:MAG TPA: glycosyltransferase family 39 protein [Pyrinomonadaceae bacterium]|nr:glycosyltransferase family 39 protein [Pyrinomonadaceae bacterium]